ncbi:MAG: HEPN domain-containing protein [Methanosarcinales archaeon]|nr:HEPN domain-containing protein [Methanosarcinales archaeon]
MAQQCAEKYLKASLIACNIEPPRTHSLETLLDLIVAEVPKLEQYRDMLTDLCPVQRTISLSWSGGNPR